MHELVFATNNSHKIAEASAILGNHFHLISLKDIGCLEELPEDKPTIKENALQKARYIYERFGCDCFADDTGLIVDSLDGAPGVYSARYAGEDCNSQNNIRKLLENLNDKKDRRAQFKTVLALIHNGDEYFFEGVVKGVIMTEIHGKGGFGYDPVFRPDGYELSFAEMDSELKNKISHRALAIKALSFFLNA